VVEAAEEEAYRSAISELDDLYPLRAGLKASQFMPTHDALPAEICGRKISWRGSGEIFRYALRTMRQGPIFALFVILTLALASALILPSSH